MRAVSASLLLLCAAAAAAVDLNPDPGLSLRPNHFTDLRLGVGMAVPATEASATGADVAADGSLGPRATVQLVHGLAGDTYGLAIGLEYAYDDNLGSISSFGGTNIAFGAGGGQVALRSHCLNLLPKVVLRPSFGDPYDWGPGTAQVEIGPAVGAGVGHAHIADSGHSDWATVWRWGFRAAVVLTSETAWQGGIEIGYEGFTSDPSWHGTHGTVSGDGFIASLFIGHRL